MSLFLPTYLQLATDEIVHTLLHLYDSYTLMRRSH